jgi:hypothetical protein
MAVYPPQQPQTPDPKDLQTHHAPELDRRLLAREVRRMTAGRQGCGRCGRAPLVGERLHVFASDEGELGVCDLCLEPEREQRRAEPVRVDRVHAGERPLNVRRAA